MAVTCPHCSSQIQIKGAKPGRYSPKCPKCGKAFVLTVPQQADALPQVSIAPPANTDVTMPSGAPPAQEAAPTTMDTDATAVTRPGSSHSAAPTVMDDATMASSPAQANPASTTDQGDQDMPQRLGGYEILKELGRGGMGAVYLARQVSLNRNVAVKVMNPQWARNHVFLSRFTREAYAAAQLVHHNVVQIYDIGEHQDISYFSMEFVEGQSIGDMIKNTGKIDVEESVGYILQAARGLKFAHDRGMIHRDIKPDNLMLNTEGIIKVADLGLVKTPESDAADRQAEQSGDMSLQDSGESSAASPNITMANQAMGTPAYMPPEQSQDAAGVDHRADIYSLGCTLYVMITGRPVFQGTTAVEVMSKHATEPVVRPEVVVKRVSKTLGDIIIKMVAKEKEDRYQSIDEVITSLQDYLGIDTTGPFTPREQHAAILEDGVAQFNSSKAALLRRNSIAGFMGLCLAMAALGVFISPVLLGLVAGLAIITALSYFILTGITEKTFLFAKTRQFVFGASIGDWLMTLFGAAAGLMMLFLLGWLWWWVGLVVAAVLLAGGFHMTLDRKVASQRKEPIAQIQDMLRLMRLSGLEEDALRQFVCRYAGERWEPVFESLFGYEAKIAARARWGKGEHGRLRKKYGSWRDPVIQWMNAREELRQQRREQKHLAKLERKALKAKGLSDQQAKQQADQAAEKMVSKAANLRAVAATEETLASGVATSATPGIPGSPTTTMPRKSFNQLLMDEADDRAARKDKQRVHAVSAPRGFINFFLGARSRFIFGILLIAGCLLWLDQNGMLTQEQLQPLQANDVAVMAKDKLEQLRHGDHAALRFPMLPEHVRMILSSINALLAGLILVFTAPFRGVKMTFFVLPAAAVILLGKTLRLPALGPIDADYVSLAVGGGLIVLGLLFGRRKI